MTQLFSALSIYGIIDRMDDAQIKAWLGWHQKLAHPPRFINVFTAARFDQGPNVLRQVRDSLPNTTPVWRGYDGKDAWGNTPKPELPWDDSNFYMRMWNEAATSAPMAAGMWFVRRVKPYLNVIRETGAIVHLLNEASALFNAPFEMECIRLLGEEGIRAGAFAWAPGTPDWPDYSMMDDLISMAVKYKTVVMCHEYAGIKPEEQNSLINRYTSLTSRFPKEAQPDIFLGEFGLAKATLTNGQLHLDASVGWREMGISEDDYNQFIKTTAKVWYLPNKVSFSLFDWIGWGHNGSFGVATAAKLLEYLSQNSSWMSFITEETAPMPSQPIIIDRPAEAQSGVRAKVVAIPVPYRNLRAIPSYLGKDTGDLSKGDIVRRFDIPALDGPVSDVSSGKWVFAEKLDGNTVTASGWLWRDRITFESVTGSTQEVPTIPAPDPEPVPPPETWPTPPTPAPVPDPAQDHAAVVKKEYKLVIDATDEQHQRIQQAIMTILAGVIALGKSMENGMGLTLDTPTIA